jgi:hypothetical protein
MGQIAMEENDDGTFSVWLADVPAPLRTKITMSEEEMVLHYQHVQAILGDDEFASMLRARDARNMQPVLDASRQFKHRGRYASPCPCECNHGGFCGGCGHAGCGGRR